MLEAASAKSDSGGWDGEDWKVQRTENWAKKELCWSLQRTIERSQLHCVEGGTKTTEMVGVTREH